jgi:hypothetical protein
MDEPTTEATEIYFYAMEWHNTVCYLAMMSVPRLQDIHESMIKKNGRVRGLKNWYGKLKYLKETHHSAMSPTTNATRPGQASSMHHCDDDT